MASLVTENNIQPKDQNHCFHLRKYPRNYGMEQQMDFQQEKEDKIRKEKMDLVIKTKIDD